MSFIRGFVDRLLLICAIVAGGLVPGFISQYRQRLGGMLDQARADLAPWQRIAEQNFHGDLYQLIQYHLASKDPTFHAEGAAISSLVASVQHLQSEVAALHGNLFRQVAYLALHVDPAIAHATLGDWVPTFGLSTEGISFALLFALCLWLLFQILWSAGSMTGRGIARRRAQRYAASAPAASMKPVAKRIRKI
ncbi:MAG TPA: DUF2937 family protein [Steroidobacteraceae bacterium]|jgi:Protein of unknown function (DUF2937)|nr:DUF2937 family protein [Steroidobacteraceae bacterium]